MSFPREFWNRCEVCGEPTTRLLADISEPQTKIRVICGLCEAAEQAIPYEPGRFGEGQTLSADNFDRQPCPACGAKDGLWIPRARQPLPGIVICTECKVHHDI